MRIDGIQWDEGNRAKCRKHGVSLAEIEFLLISSELMVFPDPHVGEVRLRGVGRTASGRHVFLVWTERVEGRSRLLRPISARYMHEKEIEHYERQNP